MAKKSYVDNKDERLAYYPVVSRAELASFFGKDRWREAKALLDEMEADKIFTMQEVGDGYRFFPSVEHCLAYVDVRESASVGS